MQYLHMWGNILIDLKIENKNAIVICKLGKVSREYEVFERILIDSKNFDVISTLLRLLG